MTRRPTEQQLADDRIRFTRARRRCECTGQCGESHGDHKGARCRTRHGVFGGKRVQLYVTDVDDGRMALCNNCRLALTAEHRARVRRHTLIHKSGQLRFNWYMETL